MDSNYIRFSFITTLVPATIGFLVVFGWLTHNVMLIQLRPDLVPMQFNTALAALLSSALVMSFLLKNTYSQHFFLGLGLVLSVITFLQYPFSMNIGLDTLFMEPYITVKSPDPGRMAVNTSLCFSLYFIAAATYVAGDQQLRWFVTAQVLFGLVAGLAVSSLFGYFTGLDSAYGWGGLSQMAPHTALSLLFATLAFSLCMRGRHDGDDYARSWNMSVTGGSLFALLVCILLAEKASDGGAEYLVAGLFVLLILFAGLLWFQINNLSMQKQIISDMERLRLGAFNAMLDGLVVIDRKGLIVENNRAAQELFGYADGELVGRNVKCLMPAHYADEHDKYLTRYQNGGVKNVIGQQRLLDGKKKSGKIFPMLLQVGEGENKGEPVYIGVIHDMTSAKLLESQLEALNVDLMKNNEELKQANEELETFAYVASHDLRSPLRGVRQLAEWIAEDLVQAPAEVQENLELMRGRIQRMEALLNDLLAYSRIGRKQSEAELFNVEECVNNIFGLLAIPDGFTVELHTELDMIAVQKTAFEQVLRNMIENAIKHRNSDQGFVKVSVFQEARDYKILIEDDGPGIEMKYAETVFEMFQTLRPRDEVEGSGMGLSIVKKVLQNFGGRVELTPLEALQGHDEKVCCRFALYWPIPVNILTS